MQRRKKITTMISLVKMREPAPGNVYGIPQLWVRFVYLVPAGFGYVYWLFSMLELPFSGRILFWVTILSAFWFSGVFGGKWKFLITLPVTFLMLYVYIWQQKKSLGNGIGMMLNSFSDRMREYYGQGLEYFNTRNQPEDLNSLCILIAFLSVMLLSYGILRRQRMRVMAVLSAILMCLSLSIDSFPDIRAFLIWTFACLGLRAMGSKSWGKLISHLQTKAGVMMLAGAGILLAVSYLWIVPEISDLFVDNSKKVMKFQKQAERKLENLMLKSPFSGWEMFSGFTWQGKISNGQLSNQAPGRTGRTALTVTVDQKPDESIYLRGFIGGIYDGDRWLEISDEEFEAAAGEQWNLDRDNIRQVENYLLNAPFEYLSTYETTGWNPEDKYRNYQVNLIEVNGKYGYLPYFTQTDPLLGKTLNALGDGETVRKGKSLSFSGYTGYPKEKEQIYFPSPENAIFELYSQYVDQHYLYVPAVGIERLKKECIGIKQALDSFAGQDQALYQFLAISYIQQTLWNQCVYSLELEPLPLGQDYTDYFFFDQKKGFCTHFASTGVLMFRLLGIPARYATGYTVRPSEFKKDQGKDTYTASVPDGNAHAWVEVYHDFLGWIPVEVTPGRAYAQNDTVSPENEDSNLEATPEPTETADPSNPPEITEEPKQREDPESQTAKSAENSRPFSVILKVINVVLAICLATATLWGILWLRMDFLVRRRRRRFAGKNRNRAVVYISHEMYRMLRFSGYRQKNSVPDTEYARKIQKEISAFEENEFLEFVEVIQKAEFSQVSTTREEAAFCQSVYKKVEKELYNRRSGFGKLWWYYIACFQIS